MFEKCNAKWVCDKKQSNFSHLFRPSSFSQSLTKIQIVYNCTQCNHTDDLIKEKVRSALQIMNLTLYQEKTIGKNTIANFKVRYMSNVKLSITKYLTYTFHNMLPHVSGVIFHRHYHISSIKPSLLL